jgi:hypothetical protein
MAELKINFGKNNSYTYQGGTYHNQSILDRELFYLASIFGGSKYLSTFKDKKVRSHFFENDLLFRSFRDFERSESQRLLISIAAIIRNNIESNPPPSQEPKHAIVGLIKIKTKKEGIDLINTCHKILHSESIEFDYSGKPTDIYDTYLKPKVYLYGTTKEGVFWKVSLDIHKFIKACYLFY